MSSLDSNPSRYGNDGRKIRIITNSFEITLPKSRHDDSDYHQYEAITPELKDKKKLARRIIDYLQTITVSHLFEKRAVFDGQHMLFCPNELKISSGAASFKVTLPGPRPDERTYTVKLSKVGTISLGGLNPLLSGSAPNPQSAVVLQLLNILMGQAAMQAFVHKSRSFYPDRDVVTTGAYEIWSGMFQSMRPAVGRLLVNVDTSTAVMYRRGQLIDIVLYFLDSRNSNVRELELSPQHPSWMRVRSFLKGVKVEVRNLKRKITIVDIEPRAGRYTFTKDEQQTDVETYYRTCKNIRLAYPNLPGIVTFVNKTKAVIPFELCQVIPGQFFKKKLPPTQMSYLLKQSTKKPQQRLSLVREALKTLNHKDSDYVRRAGIQVSSDALTITGRVLNAPAILYNSPNAEVPRDGSWNLKDKRLKIPGNLKAWSVIAFDRVHPQDLRSFTRGLVDALEKLGIVLGKEEVPILTGNPQSIETEMMNAGHRAVDTFKPNPMAPTLIVAILPKAAPELRKRIKRWGDVEHGVATQAINSDHVKKTNGPGPQYFGNLALKINVKIGGVNMVLANGTGVKWFNERPTMIVGADVSHPGPGINRPSIVGVVSSVDNQAVRYVASTSIQPCRQEIIEDLVPLFKNSLEQFFVFNGKRFLPERIVFYRDGVSEGEYEQVASEEIGQIKRAIVSFLKDNPLAAKMPAPKLTFIVVGKRHHVRFFPQGNDGDRSGNCPGGLVVDREITSPNIFDFYLQSHSGLLGTSRPSHYIVLEDENGMGPDKLQGLSYDLCHLYARATRTVSIPAPVYYADIVCSRADIHFQPDLNFSDDGASTVGSHGVDINVWKDGFRPPTLNQARSMYFM